MSTVETDPMHALPTAWGGPHGQARLRQVPEDFIVEEDLGYGADGDGEHLLLHIRKRQLNTTEVAGRLARWAGVPRQAIGYAGLKDREAITSQTFSVALPGRDLPSLEGLEDERLQVLEAQRHRRKVRTGALRGNRFRLRLRAFSGDRAALEHTLAQLRTRGMPNYFGAQRFGHAGGNLTAARALLLDGARVPRARRGLLYSAARSWLFNQVLAARVRQQLWQQALPGDVFSLDGRRAQFQDPGPEPDPALAPRLAGLEIHPTGPLCGRPSRALAPAQAAAALEADVLAPHQVWIDALAARGLDADRRALRARVTDLSWQWADDDLILDFGLPAGSYATTLLSELIAAA